MPSATSPGPARLPGVERSAWWGNVRAGQRLVEGGLGGHEDEPGPDEDEAEPLVAEPEQSGTDDDDSTTCGERPRQLRQPTTGLRCDEVAPEHGDEDDREDADDGPRGAAADEA